MDIESGGGINLKRLSLLILAIGLIFISSSSGGNIGIMTNDIEMPEFNTALKEMNVFITNNYILYPEDAVTYITPENEVVVWYADNTVLTDSGLFWSHNLSDVEFTYQSDNELFNNPYRSDMWQNPDYYLTHGLMGDCEDFAVAFASILEAKGIHARVIGVDLIDDTKHWVVEYEFNDMTNFADINLGGVTIWHDINPTLKREYVSITSTEIVEMV